MVYSGEQRSAALRATDSDRDGAVNLLNDALSVGRLTADEHGERLEAALTAKTLDQLAALTADLGPSTVTDSSRSRLPQWIALIAAASVLVILLVTLLGRNSQREPALTSGAATTAAQPTTVSAKCNGSSGSILLSCAEHPVGTRTITPRFEVSTIATLHYAESSNCASGTLLLYIYQVGVSSIPELSLFGCNSLTYNLTKGTYYIVFLASGDWKLLVTSG